MAILKPCPFCGGEATLNDNENGRIYSYVKCRECGAKTRLIKTSAEYSSDERAVEKWNTRTNEGKYMAARSILNSKTADSNSEYEEYNLKPGNYFYYNDIKFVCLDITDSGDYFAITADIYDKIQFNEQDNDDSNNWAISDLRKWLNDIFYNSVFDSNHLVKIQSDLTADNGDTKYGICEDFVTLLSCDQYRKYRKFVPYYGDYIWTLTPWGCDVGYSTFIRIVTPSGALYNHSTIYSNGIAPVCTFNHEVLKAHRRIYDSRIILKERQVAMGRADNDKE